jgi:hypothetical protein
VARRWRVCFNATERKRAQSAQKDVRKYWPHNVHFVGPPPPSFFVATLKPPTLQDYNETVFPQPCVNLSRSFH